MLTLTITLTYILVLSLSFGLSWAHDWWGFKDYSGPDPFLVVGIIFWPLSIIALIPFSLAVGVGRLEGKRLEAAKARRAKAEGYGATS